jgi:hypothetical protein
MCVIDVSATAAPMVTANASIKPIELALLHLPETADSAVDKVTINQMRDQPASYDNTLVYISGLRDTKQIGALSFSKRWYCLTLIINTV